MKILGRLAVFPTIPTRIERLYELAYNLWWSWTPSAQALYALVNANLWERTEHNASMARAANNTVAGMPSATASSSRFTPTQIA